MASKIEWEAPTERFTFDGLVYHCECGGDSFQFVGQTTSRTITLGSADDKFTTTQRYRCVACGRNHVRTESGPASGTAKRIDFWSLPSE